MTTWHQQAEEVSIGAALDKVLQVSSDLTRAMNTVIEGKEDVVRTTVTALLAEGHLLIEDGSSSPPTCCPATSPA